MWKSSDQRFVSSLVVTWERKESKTVFMGEKLTSNMDGPKGTWYRTYLQHNPQYFYLVCYAVSADCKAQRTVGFPISFFQTGRQWNYDLQTLQDYSCPWSFVTVDHNRTDWGQVNLPCSNVTAVHLRTNIFFLNLVKILWIQFFLVKFSTVKLGDKERLNSEQPGNSETFAVTNLQVYFINREQSLVSEQFLWWPKSFFYHQVWLCLVFSFIKFQYLWSWTDLSRLGLAQIVETHGTPEAASCHEVQTLWLPWPRQDVFLCPTCTK